MVRDPRKLFRGTAAFAAVLAVAIPALLAGCGGGGGGSSVVYKGSEDPAPITSADATDLTAAVVTAQAFNFPALAAFTKAGADATTPEEVLAGLSPKRLHEAMMGLGKAGDGARLSVKITQPCPEGGSVTIEAPSDTATTGTFRQTFFQCDLGDGFLINGSLVDTVTAATATVDAGSLLMNLSMSLSGASFQFSANATYNLDSGALQDSSTGDYEFWDNVNDMGMRIQGMDITETFANVTDWGDDCALTSDYAMTVFASDFGGVDIATTSPVVFTTNQCINPGPSSGGPIVITGADGATITLTPLSTSQATVDVDEDGDTVTDATSTELWVDLGFL
jgi:hypothetical protein